MSEPLIRPVQGHAPQLHAESWVAPHAALLGRVTLGARASIWYGATLRAEFEPIVIGEGSNIQDGCTLHVDPGFPLTVGTGVSVGHNAVLHGCTVGDGALVGMGAIVLNGARIGAGALVAAGTVVPQGFEVPPGSMIAGVPGKVRRELTEDEIHHNRVNAEVYEHLMTLHRDQ